MQITTAVHPARVRDYSLIVLAYILAVLAAILTYQSFSGLHPVYTILAADIAGTLVVYVFGRIFRNASFYDPYWSLAPLVIALYWILVYTPNNALAARQIIVTALVFAWGLRLTFNWARGWRGIKHEDWRYTDFRNNTGGWFWLVDLVGIELMPTLFVFLGCLSLYPALSVGNNPFGFLDIAAFIVTAGAILLETTADEQLKSFTGPKHEPGAIMAEGLWKYSRHPNYLGEVGFWWGLYLFALAADAGYWWTMTGPAAITLLFTLISIPLMEKRQLSRRPDYAEYREKVSPLLLWFPRK